MDLAATRPLSELEQQGLVKSFELTFELAWNTWKDLFPSRGVQNLYGSRDAVRASHAAELIADGNGARVWIEMIQSRNLTAHTYDAETTAAVVQMVCDAYIPGLDRLQTTLDPHRQLEDRS